MLPHLDSFVEVARFRSVSRAADTMFITQPALTARLQQLERCLGAPLFVRNRAGMRLTDAGRGFLPYAQHALDTIDEGCAILAATLEGRAGEIALGATPAVSSYVLPRFLRHYIESSDNVRVTVHTAATEEILALVLDDRVQLGITRAVRHREIDVTSLWDDDLVLVVHPTHPFATRTDVCLSDIANTELVFDRTCSYDEVRSVFRSASITIRAAMECDNIETVKRIVGQGMGGAFLPRSVIEQELAARTLVSVAVSGMTPIWRRVVALRRRSEQGASELVDACLDALEVFTSEFPTRPEVVESPKPAMDASGTSARAVCLR